MLFGYRIHRSPLAACVLLALLCLCGFIIIRQGRRIMSLEAALSDSQSPVGTLREGTTISPFQVRDIGGNFHVIGFDKPKPRPTIFYVLRPGCAWCKRNSANFAFLASRVSGEYDVIGLSLVSAGLDDFVRREDIRFPVYTDVSPATRTLYRLGSTPETIVVSSTGKVVKSWIGAYAQDPVRSDVERFFSLRFPASQSTLLD